MDNLKKAVSKIISTAMTVDSALEDKKINVPEGMRIGISAIGWVWIFKNFDAVAADFKAMKETDIPALNAYISETLDLRNDVTEAVVEQALEIILNLAAVMVKTREAA
jgi:hypothetical protein